VTRRLAAVLMLPAALGLHFGLAAPARRQRDEAREEFARLREERERLRAQSARRQRRAASVRAPSGDAEAVRALRLSFLRSVEGLPLRAVRISAEVGRQGVGADRGRLAAEGGQADLLRAAGKLAESSSGVLLENVHLALAPGDDLRLEIEAFSFRASAGASDGLQEQAPSPLPPRVARSVEAPRLAGDASAVRPADPAGIRDVFRFADEPLPTAHGEPTAARVGGERTAAPAGPRLVGLVRRAGRLMAALSVDGEIELAGPGDSAAGVTVLAVGEEGVRVRRADGSEQTLALP
jgi:hypothetical protein